MPQASMPQPARKKAYNTPQLTSFGKWPWIEKKIREWARDHGIPPEEIEIFLDETRNARLDEIDERMI